MNKEHAEKLLADATPAPWFYDGSLCVFGGTPPKNAGHQWKNTVCQVQMTDTVTGLLTKSEREGNARLIEAAPELAKAVIKNAKDAVKIETALAEIEKQLKINEGYFTGGELFTLQILQGHVKDQIKRIRAAIS